MRWGGALAAVLLLAWQPARAQLLAVEIGLAGEIEPADPDAPVIPPADGNLVGSSPQRPKRFIHIGSHIDARYCTLFGFTFRAPNLPPSAAVPITVQLDHPLWHSPDGRTGTRESYPNVLRGGQWSYTGYGLEESWTLTPGTWRFTVLYEGKTLATQSFELQVDPGQPFPTEGCAAPVS